MITRWSARSCTWSGTPALSRPKEENVVPGVVEGGVGQGCLGRGEHKAAAFRKAPGVEALPVDVPGHGDTRQIVHAGSLEVLVGEDEACGLDDIDFQPETGGKPQDGAGIAGDVGLVKGDAKVGHAGLICDPRRTLKHGGIPRVCSVIGLQQLAPNVALAGKAGWQKTRAPARTRLLFHTHQGGPSMDLFGISRQPRFMAAAA